MPKKRRNNDERKLAPVFHIYCEGEKTEPNYLNGYIGKSFPGSRLLSVIKVENAKKNTPLQLVEETAVAKNDKDCPDEDIFWVVFDRESVAKYPNKLHLEAYQCAQKHGVNIAISNVCFEIWILLHFQRNTAAYSSCDDLIKNSDLRKKHIKNYSKSDKGVFDVIVDRIADARKNAIAMNKNTIGSADESWKQPYQWNPFSDVYKLLDAIDEFGKESIT